MSLRSLTLLLSVVLAAGQAGADESPLASAPAPDDATIVDVVRAHLPPDQARTLGAMPEAKRVAEARKLWSQRTPGQQALDLRRLAWAKERFVEAGRPVLETDRAVAFFLLGPPSRIHVEPDRPWANEMLTAPTGPADVVAMLGGSGGSGSALPPTGGGPPAILDGPVPTRLWVYQRPGGDLQVLSFVDQVGDGSWRLVKVETLPATAVVSPAPAEELPPELFEQVGLGEEFDELPELAEAPLSLHVGTAMFKAAEAKTFVRFVVGVKPADVDVELATDPATWLPAATVLLQVEKDGTPLFQGRRQGLPGQGDPAIVEVGVPLLPGDYTWTAVVHDAGLRGGRLAGTLSVPALSGPLALSSLVLARAEVVDGQASLPKAAAPEDAEGETLAPFQVGSYVVRPEATFRVGDTLAAVVQVYNAPKAELEFDIYRGSKHGGSLEKVVVDRTPATEIQLIPIVEGWPADSYRLEVTAVDPASPDSKVVVEAPFRIRG